MKLYENVIKKFKEDVSQNKIADKISTNTKNIIKEELISLKLDPG